MCMGPNGSLAGLCPSRAPPRCWAARTQRPLQRPGLGGLLRPGLGVGACVCGGPLEPMAHGVWRGRRVRDPGGCGGRACYVAQAARRVLGRAQAHGAVGTGGPQRSVKVQGGLQRETQLAQAPHKHTTHRHDTSTQQSTVTERRSDGQEELSPVAIYT